MRKLGYTPDFKKDLSNIELLGIEKILDNIGKYGNIEALDGLNHERYGLAYTSSSSYAMYNVTNVIIFKFPYIRLNHLAITENDMLIAVCENEDEKTLYYEIETSDFY